jgi:hypothetical protein
MAVLCLAGAAKAAQVPTPAESAALDGLLKEAIGGSCDARLSTPLPLIGGDAIWGHVVAVCEHPGQGGAGIRAWGVWAHRSSAAAGDWMIGPWVELSSLSDVNGRGLGEVWIDRDGPPLGSGSTPTVAEMTRQFGKPRRTACRARWAKLALSATACASGRVTKVTLGAPWRLEGDEEDFAHSGNASVEVGDAVALARYLDPRLRTLRDNERFRLPRMHIGSANVTITVVARGERIRAIEISLRRARSASTRG